MKSQFKLPEGMNDGILANVLPDGRIEIALASGGKIRGSFNAKPASLGFLITQLMGIAITAQRQTGKPLQSNLDQATEWPWVMPSTLGLAPSPLPDHECLMVRFGDASLGFPIQTTMLRELAQAMITASAASAGPKN